MVRNSGMLQSFRPGKLLFSWLSANDWWSGKSGGWTQVNNSSPGDIITDGHHIGIVSGKNTSISAASSGVVVENDWGFRDANAHIRFFRYEGQIYKGQRALGAIDLKYCLS
jgi:hypothetical protein